MKQSKEMSLRFMVIRSNVIAFILMGMGLIVNAQDESALADSITTKKMVIKKLA